MRQPFRKRLALAGLSLSFACLLSGCASAQGAEAPFDLGPPMAEPAEPELGLMGTIPLFWGESAGIGEVLGGEGEAHWARPLLEQRFALRPLAALTSESLAGLEHLLMAQPRALAPSENVALDAWVRAGGQLLLLADPMLTGHSRFALGDRRRPQDVILLSPILNHWGLTLEFEPDQPAGPMTREIAGQAVPVTMPGRFVPPLQPGCTVEASGLLATCKLGQGQVTVLADAALLDLHEPAPQAASAFEMLLARAFPAAPDSSGAADKEMKEMLQSSS